MGLRIDRIAWRRQTRRFVATLVAALCMTSLSWARAPGPYFASLQTGNAAAFDNVPALMIRAYLNKALATYASVCPETAASHEGLWDLAAYMMKMPPQPKPSQTVGPYIAATGLYALEAKKMEAWMAGPGNAENDVLWFTEQSTCAAAAHRAWVANVKAIAQDPRIAGTFPQAQALCVESGASASVCACFAMSYGMEATPAERRRVLDSQPPIEGLRATLRSDYLATRVTYKCEVSPPITSPDTEYLQTSDEQQRLREGTYRMHFPLANRPSTATCTLSRRGAWLYLLNCNPMALTGSGMLSSSGDALRVHYRGHKPEEIYRVLADGTLRLLSRNPRVAMDLLPGGAPSPASGAALRSNGASLQSAPNTAEAINANSVRLTPSPPPSKTTEERRAEAVSAAALRQAAGRERSCARLMVRIAQMRQQTAAATPARVLRMQQQLQAMERNHSRACGG